MNATSESLKQLTEEEIAALKESLISQIKSNTSLTEQQKKEIENEIKRMNAETVASLDDAKKVLQEEINSLSGDTEKMNTAIESLTITCSDNLNKAKEDLSAQIKSNAELTEEEQQKLLTMINDLDTETGTSIEDIKETLRQNMSEQTTSLNNAVSDLNTTIDTIKVSVENTNGRLQDFDNELQSTNNTVAAISSSLSNMTTDIWISEVMLPVSSFSAYDNGYACVITNNGFKTDSNVEIDYAEGTCLSVIDYVQQDGSLTIVVSDMPTSDVLIEGIHIENKPENN